jgi:hypothetical protein
MIGCAAYNNGKPALAHLIDGWRACKPKLIGLIFKSVSSKGGAIQPLESYSQSHTPAVIELAPLLGARAIDDQCDTGASQRRFA